jgi:hypothetical protein
MGFSEVIKRLIPIEFACQQAVLKGGIGQNTDTLRHAEWKQIILRFSTQKVISRLKGIHSPETERGAELLDIIVAASGVSDFPLLFQDLKCPRGFFGVRKDIKGVSLV